MDYVLLPSQKNAVFELIKKNELDPFSFEWKEANTSFGTRTSSYKIPILVYKGTSFRFEFEFQNDAHYSIYSPGLDKIVDQSYPGSWDGQVVDFCRWLSVLKREISVPDFWVTVSKYKNIESEAELTVVQNEPFSVGQFEQLKIGLEEIRDQIIKDHAKSNKDKENINAKIDYLIDSARRLGKKDWFLLCIGQIITLAQSLLLSPEQTMSIWTTIKSILAGVIKYLPN